MRHADVDAAVIGGGFFGCITALELRRLGKAVLLAEREAGLMQRASYANQARIHQGYHYPRSLLTALRSRENFQRFIDEFPGCVRTNSRAYYAIARRASKITARQFVQFCRRIGAPVEPCSPEVRGWFSPHTIEDVFEVEEYVFDVSALKQAVEAMLQDSGVDVRLDVEVQRIVRADGHYEIALGAETVVARDVFNCTYSNLNTLQREAGGEVIRLRHELAEVALVEPPRALAHAGVTVMDGPFFSIMPFPAAGLHSFTHVRYTPHAWWDDAPGGVFTPPDRVCAGDRPVSAFPRMLRDAVRYMPILAETRYRHSLFEIKTLLPQTFYNDGRPILFHESEAAPRFFSVLGGKIDNIFDVRPKIAGLY